MSPEELGFVVTKKGIRPNVSADEGDGFIVDVYAKEMVAIHPLSALFVKTGVRFKLSGIPKGTQVDYQSPYNKRKHVEASAFKNKGEIEVHVANNSAKEIVIINRGDVLAQVIIGG